MRTSAVASRHSPSRALVARTRHVSSEQPRKATVVIPQANPAKPWQSIARIGGQLCFFEPDCPAPPVNAPSEVMITRPAYRKKPNGYYDLTEIVALMLRVVTDQHALASHMGFECSGSMCRTLADAEIFGEKTWLTPGRTGVYVADNVNAPKFHARAPLRPGFIWVNASAARAGGAPLRAEGLVTIADASYADFISQSIDARFSSAARQIDYVRSA